MYDEESIQMKAGDVILVYTDGVTEALGENGGWYTVDLLRNVLEAEKLGTSPWKKTLPSSPR